MTTETPHALPSRGVRSFYSFLPSWLSIDRFGLCLLLVLFAAYIPLSLRLARWLWYRDHYSFFPLGITAALALIVAAFADPNYKPASKWLRRFLVAIAFASLLVATLLVSPWLAGVSSMFLLAAIIYALGGWQVAKKALPAWLLLWLVIPIPLSYDRELIVFLQGIATQLSSGILDLIGYRHMVDGVVLRLPAQSYQVEEACSGVQSLFSALFCTGLYLILNRAGIGRSLLVLGAAFFWVLVANISRITAVVVLKEEFSLPVDVGVYHQMLGVVFFALTLLAIFSTERFLCFLWPASIPPYWHQQQSGDAGAAQPRRKRKRRGISSFFEPRERAVVLGMFGVLALVQYTSIALGGSMASASRADIELLAQPAGSLVPELLDDWQNDDYQHVVRESGNVNGEVSQLWKLSKGELRAQASIDGPYTNGWHYLTDCYRGQGWDDTNIRFSSYRDAGFDRGGDFMAFDVSKEPEQYGHVITGLFDNDYRAFLAPQVKKMQRHAGRLNDLKRLVKSLFGAGDATVAKSDSLSFQIQVFCQSPEPLTDAQRRDLADLFHSFRQQVAPIADTVGIDSQ
ncbi:Transmembrane exosortase (Exosortase_EpsH) [Rosistilla carotiformis]|uniref:Transmembrane exosortase (Exosortase_EpsH) n=1 Tax=Rosistilla carotiformis TaxID=2528017 RepID=A0A518JVC8_9BACT|nr:exosortase U [Rosistilla carotiformis]QDV69503.1 Transmembrane exosortase (Exosortase_EpsH) [Rosistilla carotiformis]